MGAIAFGAFIAGKPGGEASGHSPLEASRFDGSSYFRRGLVGTFDALRLNGWFILPVTTSL